MNCKDCPHQAYKQLTIKDIRAHLQGRSYNGSDVIGVYPLLKNGTCRFLVFDFDNHEKGAEKKDFTNTNETWLEEIEAMRTICGLNGIDPLVERSRSGRGAHFWILFDKPIPASLARRFGFALLEKGAEQVNLKSFKYYDRMLPAQDTLPEGGLGNLIALPLQGQAMRKGNSAFIDSNWNAYPNQWDVLWSKPRLSIEFIEAKIKEWAASDITEAADDNGNAEEREQPWKKEQPFRREDVNGKFSLVLSNGIYIDSLNLKAALQNQIRRLAAIRNPIFYKNAAIGMSNFATAQWIYLGKDHLSGYIEIPRGLYNRLIEKIKEADIPFEISDERQCGRHINVTFAGELRQEQKPALEEMMKYDNGILQAATAFGKTVVCSAMIAEKKVNTLIILESSALLEQWKDALEKFLDIDEKLPEYKTKTGRIRVRNSLIGKLQGAHDSMTGIVDIAMAGSLCKKGEWHPLLGPIRYSYSAKEKVKAQGIPHLVYPRFTRTVLPRGVTAEKMHPNEAYEMLRHNEARDEQILSDVKDCIAAARTPVILSKYKDHSERLYDRMKGYADRVFLMTGNNSKKEHKQIREQLQQTAPEETLALVATGSLIGEGFDFPRLDTLIMATPVSFRSVVEQYAGRLNRNYAGKKDVIVFDYVDSHIPMFERMYGKRLKAYKQIGYEICCGLDREKQEANAIFDSENYKEVFRRDLLEAEQRIVISSNVISAKKVYEMRQAGFFIKTVEDSCENFAVIDQEIIWYGNIHLLGKEKVEDNIMRVKDKKIAAELLELAFK
ncbi:DEAD/DEAH box helicase family protein [[Ruminococcus] torques]|nr:DEAD/DEAH box helicase family protein [[Ruminococcus] torques]MDM8235419.1 DEAD/DEAH box helicase family protein [[Ruminococcus] torques]